MKFTMAWDWRCTTIEKGETGGRDRKSLQAREVGTVAKASYNGMSKWCVLFKHDTPLNFFFQVFH